jgi:hypothetical protein
MMVRRENVITMVGRMRELWPEKSPLDEVPAQFRAEVEEIQNGLVTLIQEAGYPGRVTTNNISRKWQGSLEQTRQQADEYDAGQEFWIGVSRGMMDVKARLSPDGEVDTNDPLMYLINKGKWAVLDYRRARNTRRIMQTCHVCGSQHRIFRPNLSQIYFDAVQCKKIRHNTKEDISEIELYRARLINEKFRRLPAKNICKECYTEGVRSWYPESPVSHMGDRAFELELDNISFIHYCMNTDIIEVSMSDTVLEADDVVSVIENASMSIFGEEDRTFERLEEELDLEVIKDHIFFGEIPSEKLEIMREIFDMLYGDSDRACTICPRKAKFNVMSGRIDLELLRRRVGQLVNSSVHVNLGDWDLLYSSAVPCNTIPSGGCDNFEERIARLYMMQPIKARNIVKDLKNRVGAYRTIDSIINEVLNDTKRTYK